MVEVAKASICICGGDIMPYLFWKEIVIVVHNTSVHNVAGIPTEVPTTLTYH